MNEEGNKMLLSVTEKIEAAMSSGQYEQATQLWGTAEGIVEEVRTYILTYTCRCMYVSAYVTCRCSLYHYHGNILCLTVPLACVTLILCGCLDGCNHS